MKLKHTLLTISALGSLVGGASAQLNTLDDWRDIDNGDAGVATEEQNTGAASFTGDGSGTITITGAGRDLWGGEDTGVFLSNNTGAYTTTGDYTATVRHVSTDSPAPEWGRDGILARNTSAGLDASNPNFMTVRKSNGGVVTGWRDTQLGGTGSGGTQFDTGNVATDAYFLSSARDGSTMRSGAAIDLNGFAGRWVEIANRSGIAAFDAGQELTIGLGHQSHYQSGGGGGYSVGGGTNTATFDNLSYAGSYDSSKFGPASSPSTWEVGGLVWVAPGGADAGLVKGNAYVKEAGSSTGEATKWTVNYASTTMVPVFGLAGSTNNPGVMDANDLVPAANFRTSPGSPGLNAEIYMIGNTGNRAGNLAIISGNAANGTVVIPNVDWNGGGDNDANYFGLTGPASFGAAVQGIDPANNTAGAFSGDQEDYGVYMTGEIFIPADGNRVGGDTILFKDGIDDYVYLRIDGIDLIDDNSWTSPDGTGNAGGALAAFDASDSKYDDGEWVTFEMIMWEGGGGDAGKLYWDAGDSDGSFAASGNAPPMVPETTGMMMGFTQIGTDATSGDFGFNLPEGEWDVTLTVENTNAITTSTTTVTVVPEPSTPLFIGLGAVAMILRRRRR
jgi:hypothetical protein